MVVATSPAFAWGPMFHYLSACSTTSDANCLCSGQYDDLLVGSFAPDAFFFGGSPFIIASACPANVSAIHDPVFAGYLVNWAPQYSTTSFNASAFALGFGTHVVADAVGFGFPRGYFMADPAVLVNQMIDWLYTWPLMVAIDSAVVTSNFTCGKASLPSHGFSTAAATFIAESSVRYAAMKAGFPVVDATTVQTCGSIWQTHVSSVAARNFGTPASASLETLVVYDPYGSQNSAEAQAALIMQETCAVHAISVWQQALASGAAPGDAVAATGAALAQLYDKGVCSPQ
jgi:hypothetical protein